MVDKYSDKEIIDGLLANDPQMISYFFNETCTPLISHIIGNVYKRQIDKYELISELYIYLKDNDWRRLRQFDHHSKLTTWLWIVAMRFFLKKKRTLLIENTEPGTLIEKGYDPVKSLIIEMDMQCMLEKMPNARYREMLRELFIKDQEPKEVAAKMNITLDVLYNVKHRALQQIAEIMKKEGYGGYI